MMNKLFFQSVILGLVLSLGISGCRTVPRDYVRYTVKRDAKYKLDGISKIGIIDFNSLHDDQNKQNAADRQSVSMAQELVTQYFKNNPKYDLVDFDMERDIVSQGSTRPKKRLDGLLYGQVWYQTTPEYQGYYPKLFRLVDSAKIHYQEVSRDGSMAPVPKNLILRERDCLENISFRSKRATAIVTLSLYRLDSNGLLVKMIDFIETASRVYTLDNGVPMGRISFSTGPAKGQKGELNNYFTTDLAVKQGLISAASRRLLDQLLPQELIVKIFLNFSNRSLAEKFKSNRFEPAGIIDFCVKEIVRKAGPEIAVRIPALNRYAAGVRHDINVKVKDDQVLDAIESCEEYLLAIAVCQESMGDTASALSTYRMLMHKIKDPDHCEEIATAISRCIAILGIRQEYKNDMEKHNANIKWF